VSGRGRARERRGPEPLDVKITVMFQATEREHLAAMAEADGITDSEFLRRLVRHEWKLSPVRLVKKGAAQP